MQIVKIKFIKSPVCDPFNMAYFVGDIVSMEKKQADELITAGYAILPGKEDTNLPKEFPYRNKFAALDIKTIEEIVKIGRVSELEGITEFMEDKVNDYLLANGIIKETAKAKAEIEAKVNNIKQKK